MAKLITCGLLRGIAEPFARTERGQKVFFSNAIFKAWVGLFW